MVQGNSAEMLRGSSQSLEADWEGSLLEGTYLLYALASCDHIGAVASTQLLLATVSL